MKEAFERAERNVIIPSEIPAEYRLPSETITGFFTSPDQFQDQIAFGYFKPDHATSATIVFPGTSECFEKYALMVNENADKGIATFFMAPFSHDLSSRIFENNPALMGARPIQNAANNQRHFRREIVHQVMASAGLDNAPITILSNSQSAVSTAIELSDNPKDVKQVIYGAPMWGQHDLSRLDRGILCGIKQKWIDTKLGKPGTFIKTRFGQEFAEMLKPTPPSLFKKWGTGCRNAFLKAAEDNEETTHTRMSRLIFQANPHLACYEVTANWILELLPACRIVQDPDFMRQSHIPALIITANREELKRIGGDKCVENRWAHQFAELAPNAALCEIEGSDHDILSSRYREKAIEQSHMFCGNSARYIEVNNKQRLKNAPPIIDSSSPATPVQSECEHQIPEHA